MESNGAGRWRRWQLPAVVVLVVALAAAGVLVVTRGRDADELTQARSSAAEGSAQDESAPA